MHVNLVLLIFVVAACDRFTPESQASAQADSVAVNRARCILPVGTTVADSLALRCAELFAVRNGYTDLPAVPDSTQWTYEFMDLGVERRRGMLERRAHALCGDVRADSAVLVVFRYGRPEFKAPPVINEKGEVVQQPPTGRAVLVRSDLSSMRFMHQDVVLRGLEDERFGRSCRIFDRNGASQAPPAQQANAGDEPAP